MSTPSGKRDIQNVVGQTRSNLVVQPSRTNLVFRHISKLWNLEQMGKEQIGDVRQVSLHVIEEQNTLQKKVNGGKTTGAGLRDTPVGGTMFSI